MRKYEAHCNYTVDEGGNNLQFQDSFLEALFVLHQSVPTVLENIILHFDDVLSRKTV